MTNGREYWMGTPKEEFINWSEDRLVEEILRLRGAPSVEEGARPDCTGQSLACMKPGCRCCGPFAPSPESPARCDRCEGRGTVALPWVNGPDVKCSRCGGTGTKGGGKP